MRPGTTRAALRFRRLGPAGLALGLAALALPPAAHAQTASSSGTATAGTRATGRTSPAGRSAAPSGPQSAVPSPLPPGSGADTPGGSARNGVIAPPGTSGSDTRVIPK